MSHYIPAGLKAGPGTTNTLVRKGYLIIYIILIWLSLIAPFFVVLKIIDQFEISAIFLLLIFPIYILIAIIALLFTSMFWSWIMLKIVNLIHKPKEGYFPRDPKNIDYRFWSLRAVIKKFPIWLSHNTPIPWIDSFIFKLYGNNIPLKISVFDGWIDSEFLEIGAGSVIGQGSVVMTSMLTTEFLIIKRVKIGKDSLIGAHSVVSPGTTIGDGVVLGALSSTKIGQKLEDFWVYWGNPAAKIHESKFREHDKLSSEERAKQKEHKDVTKKLSDSDDLIGRKTAKPTIALQKSKYKEMRAKHHKKKAEHIKFRAEKKARKYKLRAEIHIRKAKRKKFEAMLAMEKTRDKLEKKIKEEHGKLSTLEKQEFKEDLEEELKEDLDIEIDEEEIDEGEIDEGEIDEGEI